MSNLLDEASAVHLLFLPEVSIFKIPPMQGSSGHRAGDWDLENPAMTGQLRVIGHGETVHIQLLQAAETSAGLPTLFADCPVKITIDPSKPTSKLEYFMQGVNDSSRYFVLRIEDPVSKRHAFIGIGFRERESAFSLRAAVEDEVKRIVRQLTNPGAPDSDEEEASVDTTPTVDRSLKDGQTLKLKVPKRAKSNTTAKTSASKSSKSGGFGLLAPPKAATASSASSSSSSSSKNPPKQPTAQSVQNEFDLLSFN